MSQAFPNIKIRPHGLQFVAGNIGGLVSAVLILLLAGYDGLLPKSIFPFMMAAFGLLFINLLCKCLQMLFGLKTVSIYSGDKTCPRLDIIGVKGDTDLITMIRERVEYNKKKHNIHEFTNIR